MKKCIRWGSIVLATIIVIGVIAYSVTMLLISNNKVVEAKDTPTVEQQAIIDKDFEAQEIINDELATKEEVYGMLHEMANTKIIAEDDQIWGLQAITRQRVARVQKAVKDLGIKDVEIDTMLNKWSKKDFSDCVSEHNYVWNLLGGNIGTAVALRK